MIWELQVLKTSSGETLGDSEGQGSLACCHSWGRRVRHNLTTEQQQGQQECWLQITLGLLIFINVKLQQVLFGHGMIFQSIFHTQFLTIRALGIEAHCNYFNSRKRMDTNQEKEEKIPHLEEV